MLHVKSVKYVSDYTIWLSFDDGSDGHVDLKDSLKGPIFQPLKKLSIFSKLSVDPELETIVWPNGADLAPEYLKELHNKQRQSDT